MTNTIRVLVIGGGDALAIPEADLPVVAFRNDGETAKDVEALCGGPRDRVVSGCGSERLIRTIR
jgi:hypothetical protein